MTFNFFNDLPLNQFTIQGVVCASTSRLNDNTPPKC